MAGYTSGIEDAERKKMEVTKATSNEKVQEHLCEMMERLLDDELFKDSKNALVEIEKAKAMSNLVESSLQIQKVEVQQAQIKLDAVRLLIKSGYTFDDLSSIGLGLGIGNSVAEVKKNAQISQSMDA